MNCSQIQNLLSAYHDGELVDAESSQVRMHLSLCAACAEKRAAFDQLSLLVSGVETPSAPSEEMWHRLRERLASQASEPAPAARRREASWAPSRWLALAASIFVLAGLTWIGSQSWQRPAVVSEHAQFAQTFDHYLDVFQQDPDAAQNFLLASYPSQQIEPTEHIGQLGYQPAVAAGLPPDYSLVSTHVLKMPCCDCVQSVCRRPDGSALAIFEHDDEETSQWFGDRSEITARCHNRSCCLVEMENQLAASWKRGSRHITLVGARDVEEISQLVAWLDEEKQTAAN